MSNVGWVTTEEARAAWSDAPLDDAALTSLLSAAYELCSEYAPSVVPSPLPERYKRAQIAQARNMWEAERKDSGGDIGSEGFPLPVFPMDWQVKNLLRPKRAVGSVG